MKIFVSHVILIIFIPVSVALYWKSLVDVKKKKKNDGTHEAKRREKRLRQNDINSLRQGRTMVLTNNTPCSIPEENNKAITIHNRVTICEWQRGIIAHVTFIVLLPAGAEC